MIILEANGRVAMVDAEHGGLIWSVQDSNGFDLLAVGQEPDQSLRSTGNLAATGYRGWIDCFPSIDSEPDMSNGRQDIVIPGHGSSWLESWAVTSLTGNELGMSCSLPTFGVECEKNVALGTDSLRVTSSVTNRSEAPINFVWASHPLLAADETTWLELEDTEIQPWPRSVSVPARLGDFWPSASHSRQWSTLPNGTAVKLFLPWPKSGVPFFSGGRPRKLGFTIEGTGFVPLLGLWLNRGGFPNTKPLTHFAIEPTIGDTDSLMESFDRGTSGLLSPNEKVTFVVTLYL